MRHQHFYPERGADAWSDGCPACGEVLRAFAPETDDRNAAWLFGCGCEIIDDEGYVDINSDCPDAMSILMEGLVIHRSDDDSEPAP